MYESGTTHSRDLSTAAGVLAVARHATPPADGSAARQPTSGTFMRATVPLRGMKSTARAHPIQGLVKYHGMRDEELRLPYHDSISVCTAPSNTTTTAEFDPDREADVYRIGGEVETGRGAERIEKVVDEVRRRAGFDYRVRLESENNFASNIGLGSSSSGFAAAALACVEAAGLDLTLPEVSTIARRGSSSAARAVTGGFSDLYAGLNDEDCRSERLPVADDLADDLRIVIGEVPPTRRPSRPTTRRPRTATCSRRGSPTFTTSSPR